MTRAMIRSGLVRVAATRLVTAPSRLPLWYACTALTYRSTPFGPRELDDDEHPTSPTPQMTATQIDARMSDEVTGVCCGGWGVFMVEPSRGEVRMRCLRLMPACWFALTKAAPIRKVTPNPR